MSTTTQARALIAALLNGDLDATVHTQQPHEMRLPSVNLPIRASPVTAVTTVTVNGSEVLTTAYSFTPFLLVREDGEVWPAGRILITYTTGWEAGYEPAAITDALALATEWLDTHPGAGISSFRAGNEQVTATTDPEGPGVIRALIRPWVKRQPC